MRCVKKKDVKKNKHRPDFGVMFPPELTTSLLDRVWAWATWPRWKKPWEHIWSICMTNMTFNLGFLHACIFFCSIYNSSLVLKRKNSLLCGHLWEFYGNYFYFYCWKHQTESYLCNHKLTVTGIGCFWLISVIFIWIISVNNILVGSCDFCLQALLSS